MINQIYELFAKLFRGIKPWVLVAPWEQGIRIRLGKSTKRLLAGPHVRIPFIDDVIIQSVRIRLAPVGQQTLMLKSGKIVNINSTLGYRISDILALYQSLHHVEATLTSLIQTCIARVILSTDIDLVDALHIEKCVLAEIAKLDLESKGVEITHVGVTELSIAKTFRIINNNNVSPYLGRSFSTQYDH